MHGEIVIGPRGLAGGCRAWDQKVFATDIYYAGRHSVLVNGHDQCLIAVMMEKEHVPNDPLYKRKVKLHGAKLVAFSKSLY